MTGTVAWAVWVGSVDDVVDDELEVELDDPEVVVLYVLLVTGFLKDVGGVKDAEVYVS